MPLREGRKALRQHQFGSIGARRSSGIRKVGLSAATHLLNILTMMQGGLGTVDVQ
jgi:hypothetical protein